MRKILSTIGLICLFALLSISWQWGAQWGQNDIELGANSIDGHQTTGIYLDPDNDGTNEVTIDISGNISGGSITAGGTGERITGSTYGEYIDFNDLGDDYIKFGGASGTDDTDLAVDLDGEYPLLYSPTDTRIGVNGLVMDEDELISWELANGLPDRTIHWDSVSHDFHFNDDGYFEDVHPGLYILCTENRRAFGWHYHYGEAYPLSFSTGIHNGTEIVLDSGVPLMSSDNDGTNIRFPKGIGGNTVCTGTMEAKVAVTLDTVAAVVLAADDCKSGVRVNNDNDVIDYTLPNAETGLSVVVQSMFAAVVTIDCFDGNESIVLDGTTLTAGNAIDSPGTAGDYILLVAISATQWAVMGRSGAWVDGGAD